MQVYAPDGAIGRPAFALAPSPPVLTGLRIGVLDNAKPNAGVLMVRCRTTGRADRGGGRAS